MDVDLLAKNHCARVPTDEKSRPYILQLGHNDQGRALCPITGYLRPKIGQGTNSAYDHWPNDPRPTTIDQTLGETARDY